jgi:hypothetical protein
VPSGAGLDGFAATAVGGAPLTIQGAHSGMATPSAAYVLSRSITLLENENFDVQITFPSAPALTANTRVRTYLGGELSRSIQ